MTSPCCALAWLFLAWLPTWLITKVIHHQAAPSMHDSVRWPDWTSLFVDVGFSSQLALILSPASWLLSVTRARYCEYMVANAPKILRMRLNKLPWWHCGTQINVCFPPAVCSFLLVPTVVSLVWPMIQNDLFHNLWSHVYSSLTAMFTMTIIQLYY